MAVTCTWQLVFHSLNKLRNIKPSLNLSFRAILSNASPGAPSNSWPKIKKSSELRTRVKIQFPPDANKHKNGYPRSLCNIDVVRPCARMWCTFISGFRYLLARFRAYFTPTRSERTKPGRVVTAIASKSWKFSFLGRFSSIYITTFKANPYPKMKWVSDERALALQMKEH